MVHFINTEGARLWTEITGCSREPYIVLISGGPGCCDYLESVARMLEDAYSVIRVELRGCGRSSGDGPYDIETNIRDLNAVRVFYGVAHWSLLGHSFGANLALCYTMAYPQFTQKLVYAAGPGMQNDRDWRETYHRNKEARGEMIPEMPYPFNEQVNAQGNASWHVYARDPMLWRDLSKLTNHALFLCGMEDPRPNWPAQQISNIMPHARLVTIPQAGHYLWLSQRQEFMKALRKFLV